MLLINKIIVPKLIHNLVAGNLHKTGTTFVTLEEN